MPHLMPAAITPLINSRRTTMQIVRLLLAGVAVAVMLTGVAVAGAYKDAEDAYMRGDYATALRLWQPLAERGNVDAQFSLGIIHFDGTSPQDETEAAKWFRLAAEQDDTVAQFMIGWIYADGVGVPRDYVPAHMWWNVAAMHGALVGGQKRDEIEVQMTPHQIAEAERLAREWKPAAER